MALAKNPREARHWDVNIIYQPRAAAAEEVTLPLPLALLLLLVSRVLAPVWCESAIQQLPCRLRLVVCVRGVRQDEQELIKRQVQLRLDLVEQVPLPERVECGLRRVVVRIQRYEQVVQHAFALKRTLRQNPRERVVDWELRRVRQREVELPVPQLRRISAALHDLVERQQVVKAVRTVVECLHRLSVFAGPEILVLVKVIPLAPRGDAVRDETENHRPDQAP
mmetsp:Transcript_31316/g.87820  ORF Transcript_31316/g.87820 Transcript_31316/m.87820 type:complete len:223 (-) Transcript_31316:451-1119(-)